MTTEFNKMIADSQLPLFLLLKSQNESSNDHKVK